MADEHTDVDAAIRRYKAAQLRPSGESTDKVEAVHHLEQYLANPAAEAFLVSVLRDRGEYDLARVEVCKALHASSRAGLGHRYAEALREVLLSEDDVLVRQWAARALLPFHDLPEVAHALLDRLADASEDSDVRHNAIASLRGAAISSAVRALLERSLSDPDIGSAVGALLRSDSK